MRLLVSGDNDLVRLWADALAPLVIRHPNPKARAAVQLSGAGTEAALTLMVYNALDTATEEPHERNPLLISSVRLTYFPGVRLARQWMAAAWAGYLQHEALELVTVGRSAQWPLNPHEEPYRDNPWNRGLRDGLPRELTPATLRKALAVVMDIDWADVLISLPGDG